ncbi:MAG: hypothetical protein DIU72_007745 [Pseudomonadota bacterium]|nr:MAG: hypothetical protein DIU72_08605 [Pseudomonadota bacterium]
MAEREMLLVQSKVRDAIKSKGDGVRTSEDFINGLNDLVHEAIEKAIQRAQKNGRATLRDYDI